MTLNKSFTGLILATGLLLAPPVHATIFTFTYFSKLTNLFGTVRVSGSETSPGSGIFDITSGTDTITGGNGGPGSTGTFTLFENANHPVSATNQAISPKGYIQYDNLLTPALDPFLDTGGLFSHKP